jgi:2-iminoacetate synthase
METFIDAKKIEGLLEHSKNPSKENILSLIEKSLMLKGLTPEDTAVLLQCEDKELLQKMFAAARTIKEEIYGNRLVLFAPLYVTNICINNCLYCGFRQDNTDLKRRQLSMEEIRTETEMLLRQGHKRTLLVAGEDPTTSNIGYVENALKTIYSTKVAGSSIRRVNVNVAPLSVEHFKRLKEAGIGTYQLFQETYHPETYKTMHPSGPKSNYDWRLYVMDRAMEAGIDDVGIGALFGLYDYKFEVLALLYHALHLESKFSVGPHTISVPRLRPAFNTPFPSNPPHAVTDDEFKKIIAVLRMAVPYTGIILSTRESSALRDDSIRLGVSQISAGSSTVPGGYRRSRDDGQFDVTDTRTLPEMVAELVKQDMIPSFCTACYRSGRTGEEFMSLAKPGKIHKFCQQNAILTFYEYLLDHPTDGLMESGRRMIERKMAKLPERQRRSVMTKMEQLTLGRRDVRV